MSVPAVAAVWKLAAVSTFTSWFPGTISLRGVVGRLLICPIYSPFVSFISFILKSLLFGLFVLLQFWLSFAFSQTFYEMRAGA